MPDTECGTANAIFILQPLQEKSLAKKKNFYSAFVDGVLRNVVC